MHQGVGGGSRHVVLYYAVVGAAAGAAALIWLVAIDPAIGAATGRRTGVWGAGVAASVVSLLIDRALARRVARARWDRLCDLALAAHACPPCAYALAGLKPDPDGCVVCPECGAAWRADRLGDRDRDPPEHARPDR